MSLDEIKKVCNNADMIVCGYAFTKKEDRKIQILQIHPPYHALILSTEGEVLETSMDDIELVIAKEYWTKKLLNTRHDAYNQDAKDSFFDRLFGSVGDLSYICGDNYNKKCSNMEEKDFIVPDSGHIDFREGEGPTKLMKFRVIKCSSKRHDPIEVKRTIRPGFRELKPGEPWDWRNAYN